MDTISVVIDRCDSWNFIACGNSKIVFQYAALANCANEFDDFVLVIYREGHFNVDYDSKYLDNVVNIFVSLRYIPVRHSVVVKNYTISPDEAYANRFALQKLENSILIGYLEANLFRQNCWLIPTRYPLAMFGLDRSIATLSIEFKPKCGFVSISPLVKQDSTSAIKKKLSRFELMLYSKYYDSIVDRKQPRWGQMDSLSNYHPSDLMSGDLERIERAVYALLRAPLNNLGLRVDGLLVFGWDFPDRSVEHALEKMKLFHASDGESPLDRFAKFVAAIIAGESIFEEIKRMQAFDVIDIEGCEVLYKRLVNIVGSSSEAEAMINESLLSRLSEETIDATQRILRIHEDTPYESEQIASTDRLTQLLHKVAEFVEHDTDYDSVMEWSQSLDADDCVLLLKAWLIALSAKDVGIVFTFATDNADDMLSVSCSLIDYGPKPVSKIKGKFAEEDMLCYKAEIISNRYKSSI